MSYRADKQVIDTHTGHTNTQTQTTTIPEVQNWPRAIKIKYWLEMFTKIFPRTKPYVIYKYLKILNTGYVCITAIAHRIYSGKYPDVMITTRDRKLK